MKLGIKRHVVTPAGQPNCGISIQPTTDGFVIFALLNEGIRVLALATPEEAEQVGIALIQQADVARAATQAPAVKPATGVLVNANGTRH